MHLYGQTSLADELNGRPTATVAPQTHHNTSSTSAPGTQRSLLARKCGYLLDEDSSPDSDRVQNISIGDVDSGHSTAHSPVDLKSLSPQMTSSLSHSPFACGGGVPYSQLEMLEATHRGLHKFMPRHHDEIDIEIGDAIYVQKEADDLWCEGVNLRTGRQGIFPSAYAVDLEYNDFDPTAPKVKKERYLLGYLGSVETLAHKGTGVVCQAVRKIVGECGESPSAQICILEISDQGLRMVERAASSANVRFVDVFCAIIFRIPIMIPFLFRYCSKPKTRKSPASTISTRSKMYHSVHFIHVTIGTLASLPNIRRCNDLPVTFSKVKSRRDPSLRPSGKPLYTIISHESI